MASAADSSSSAPFTSRSVSQTLLSREQGEGVGARVRRSIGRPELPNFDPFLMLDEFNVNKQGGFPDHPHRGFETVTYMFPDSEGSFQHEDFMGNHGFLKPGVLQWMTAGKGILHSEMPDPNSKGPAHGLQLWVNLAKKDKLCDPAYQELPKDKVPKVKVGGIEAHVIAGSALGINSPVYTRTPVHYIHFYMDAHSTLNQPIPSGWNAFIYSIGGDIAVGPNPDPKKMIEAHHTITLTRGDDLSGVTVTTFEKAANFVLLCGEPINEPIVQHGPFVMNTRSEIMEAIRDYQLGRNGFERAPGWRSEIGRPITDRL